MDNQDCFFSTEIREQGCFYTGCKYQDTKYYPPSCARKSCSHYLSYSDARKIVMRELNNSESIAETIRKIIEKEYRKERNE